MCDLLIQKTVPAEECERFANALTGRECRCDPSKLYTISVKAHGVTEQHPGEPVALPARKRVDPFCYDQGGNARADGWNACLDEIVKLGPLYPGADPGEAERKLEDQRREFSHAQAVEHRKWADLVDSLKARQSTLHDLLQRAYDADQAARHLQPYNVSKLMDEIEAVLDASAEPSAPVERDELTDEQIIGAMRSYLNDADGGYVVDTAPDDVVKAGRALLARAALELKPS